MINMKPKALFLDRDGIVNVEKHFVYKIEDFEFIDGIFEFCRFFQDKGYIIFIITNQSGIARGYYTLNDYNILTRWMINEFNKQNIKITEAYHCPHLPEITGECDCRKPKPGMILQAQKEFDIDLENSVVVGDNLRDIETGFNAGVKTNYLINKKNDKINFQFRNIRDLLNYLTIKK